MKSFAEKIGIIDSFEIELKISKKEFIKVIKERIEAKGHYFFGISNTNKPFYNGNIDNESFKLKRKPKFLDSHLDFIKTHGQFHEENNRLKINSMVIGYNLSLLIVFSFVIFIFLILFLLKITSVDLIFGNSLIDILFLFSLFCLVTGIPYFIIRKNVKKVRLEFESDLKTLFDK